MTFYNQLLQVFGYSGTLFNRPPGGTLLLRRLHITEELKKYETEVLTAEEKALLLEQRLFEQIRQQAVQYVSRLQNLADTLVLCR